MRQHIVGVPRVPALRKARLDRIVFVHRTSPGWDNCPASATLDDSPDRWLRAKRGAWRGAICYNSADAGANYCHEVTHGRYHCSPWMSAWMWGAFRRVGGTPRTLGRSPFVRTLGAAGAYPGGGQRGRVSGRCAARGSPALLRQSRVHVSFHGLARGAGLPFRKLLRPEFMDQALGGVADDRPHAFGASGGDGRGGCRWYGQASADPPGIVRHARRGLPGRRICDRHVHDEQQLPARARVRARLRSLLVQAFRQSRRGDG